MQEMQETWIPSLGQEDPLEKEMATQSSICWEILWKKKKKPGGLHSKGLQKVEHNWATNTFIQKTGGFWIIRLHNWLPKGNVTKVQKLKHVILLEVDIRNFRVISSRVSCQLWGHPTFK